MNIRTSIGIWAQVLSLLTLIAAGNAGAQQTYPNRPIKLIVAQPPGNSADLVARMISERLARSLGQAVVVDNKPGASGSIGVSAIAAAPADGYTIGIGGIGQLALNPTLYSKLPYDAQTGFTTIAIVYRGPMLFMVDPASPITSLKESTGCSTRRLIALLSLAAMELLPSMFAGVFSVTIWASARLSKSPLLSSTILSLGHSSSHPSQ